MTSYDVLPLTAAVRALSRGEISSLELVRAALERAQQLRELGAFVSLDRDRALRDAGRPHPGPLRGVPVAIKDLVDVAGLPTRGGTRASDASPAAADAAIVARLRASGAVIIGKTATHELAYGVTTPAVTNPRSPKVTAGGSSGGSAAALAAGIVPLALGTDTAGSVRIPAACCGVCGMIAAPGSLPRRGVMALSPSFDTLGPMVRDPADLRLAWAALGGPTGHPDGRREAVLRRALIATAEQVGAVEPQALAAVQRVAERLALPTAAADVPEFSRWGVPRAIVIGCEALASHRAAGLYPERAAQLGDEIREAHGVAASIPQARVTRARAELDALARELRARLGPGELLLTPALPHTPPPRESPSSAVAGQLTKFVAPVNAAGLAAAVVPEGPCGVQLIAADAPTLLAAVDRL
ncbi:MAG: amidase [Acidobacteriota bacterium]|nr:amidase [Acidobacteriota bacterium]